MRACMHTYIGEERGDGSKTMGGSLKDLPEWGEGGVGEVGGQELELIDTGTGGGQRGEEEREGEGAARSPKEVCGGRRVRYFST